MFPFTRKLPLGVAYNNSHFDLIRYSHSPIIWSGWLTVVRRGLLYTAFLLDACFLRSRWRSSACTTFRQALTAPKIPVHIGSINFETTQHRQSTHASPRRALGETRC
jgi:hypothetical protein